MRLLIYLLAVFSITSIVFLTHIQIATAACSIRIEPESGPSNGIFSVTFTGCQTGDYQIIAISPSGIETGYAFQVNSDPSTYSLSSLSETGSYAIEVYDPLNNLIHQGGISVTEVEDVACGDIVTDQSLCPEACGAIIRNGQYQCIGVDPNPFDDIEVPNPDGTWPTPPLDCEVAWVSAENTTSEDQNVQMLDTGACVGGFSSIEEAILPIDITVTCIDKSGTIHLIGNQCAVNQTQRVTPARVNVAGEDSNGDGEPDSYYTCFEIQEINRDVGRLQITFDTRLSGSCTTDSVETLPANYDFWYEHIRRIWEDTDGSNTGEDIHSPICADGRINSAIGCIDYELIPFARFMLGWSLGVGGGVALVMIAFSGILMMFSKGDPGQVAEAKSIFVASISGLLLIILSTVLLRVIGVNILNLF